ncbi:acetoin utilization protein AcuC [Lottiidibacillus patelloidae]|uniref:Acetoin utilization protein AcuC n=1 Tax=Lottiidibacillus patelloidae TaxID=2670334 RepID=A0A263BQU7_9BACI|nr:acetoin utilization protein AcuC [Lottiidibacillus patelloidae]OZM56069.1 acetoin utilization protein AcuC [Lottiidibacillus patelloidae]
MKNALFMYTEKFANYKFNDDHPFNQKRVHLTYDLLTKIDALHTEDIITPSAASDDDIALFHNEAYITAVKEASIGNVVPSIEKYGIGTEDTPIFPNMHEAASQVVGATMQAVDLVMERKTKAAVNLAGGLHHSMKEKASGFCIYNDCAIAIEHIRKKYGARVLYVDTDAHHGDGVQMGFYAADDVCTFSIHETGKYLFPGTGNVTERGFGKGFNFSFNLPLDAFTEDGSFLHAYEIALREIAAYFKPDVIITQNGADAHCYDPLTHLMTTMRTYKYIPKIAQEIAEEYCEGRWIALGGGGYDIWRVVPRAWSNIWLTMKGISVADEEKLPEAWLNEWQNDAPVPLPATWGDSSSIYNPIPRKAEIEKKNEHTLKQMISFIK